jgi:hypothetical protein
MLAPLLLLLLCWLLVFSAARILILLSATSVTLPPSLVSLPMDVMLLPAHGVDAAVGQFDLLAFHPDDVARQRADLVCRQDDRCP